MQGLVLQDVRPRSPGSILDMKKDIFIFRKASGQFLRLIKLLLKYTLKIFPRIKTAEHETDQSPPSRAEINNKWNYV